MRFTINRSELSNAIRSVYPAIKQSIIIPITETIKFDISADSIIFTATNMQVELSFKLSGTFLETGAICLPAIKLYNLIENLPDQPLIFDSTETICQIKTTSGKYELPVSNAKDFPVFKLKADKSLSIDSDKFASAIRKTIFACGDDSSRPQQTGVYIEIKQEGISFTSTDSHRINHVEHEAVSDFEASLIIPASSLRLLPELKSLSKVSFGGNSISITCENISFKSTLIDSVFPDYKSAIPKNEKVLTVNRLLLCGSVKRVSGFSDFITNQLRLDLGEKVMISGQNKEYSERAEEQLEAAFDSEEMFIGLNSKYLYESLMSMTSETVTLLFSKPNRAVIIKESLQNNNYILVMPMQLT
jgi:DNA polymerase-3 subunit beta